MTPRLSDPNQWWSHYAKEYAGRTWTNYRWLLVEFIQFANEGPLLDVGCGYGFLTECARRFNIPAIGLEASSTAVERARQLHPLADIQAWRGGEPLPLANDSIGGAIMNEFIDHITPEQNESLFAELMRVLKPGGVIIVKSPSRFNRFDNDEGHLTFFSPAEFRAFVSRFGFHVIQQPFSPQPLLGQSRLGRSLMTAATRWVRRDRWAARIDLVARKPAGQI